MSEELADKLAAELGDLPLAAAQAAGYLEQTALPPGDYLRRFRTRRAGPLARGGGPGYRRRPGPPATWRSPPSRPATICAGSAPAEPTCWPAAMCWATADGSTPPGPCP